MKKLLLTSFIKVIFIAVLMSQAYEPLIRENTYWDENHGSGQHLCTVSGGDRFYFEGDTIINNVQYKILKKHPLYAINGDLIVHLLE